MKTMSKNFLGILLSLALVIGMVPVISMPAQAEVNDYVITFSANGKTITKKTQIPYTVECRSATEDTNLDEIIKYLYELDGGNDVKSAPKVIGDDDNVLAGLNSSNRQYITILGPVSGTATVKGRYFDLTNTFDYSLDIKCVKYEEYPLWLGGTQVTSENMGDVFGDGTVSFTPASSGQNPSPAKLTLNGYNYEGDAPGVKYEGSADWNIVLEGKNSIKCTNGYVSGIDGGYRGDLSFSGEGSLTVENYQGKGAIYTSRNIIIESGTVDAESRYSYAINSGNRDIIVKGGRVNTEGQVGLCARNNGNVTISGGTVRAESIAENEGKSIEAGGDINIYGGTVDVHGGREGIYADEGDITIDDGTVEAEGSGSDAAGIFSKNGKVTINGGKVIAYSRGTDLNAGIFADGEVKINDGTVEATGFGQESRGILAYGNVTINGGIANIAGIADETLGYSPTSAGVSNELIVNGGIVNVAGTGWALYSGLKNAIAGTGWTDVAGREGMAKIDINTKGYKNLRYKAVQFPGVAAKVTKAPEAKTLTANGSAQELVTAGTAVDGEMQYALGKDAATEPTTGWSTSIPRGTDAGDYYVWYKAAGDRTHVDSKADFVIVTIKEGPKPDPKPTPTPTPEPKPEPTPAKVSGTLMAKMTAKGNKKLAIGWTKIKGAAGYDIFFAKVGKKVKKAKSIKGNKTFKWTKSGLKKGKEYEAYVKAYVMKDGKKKYVKKSPVLHAYTGKGTKKYTNAKAVKVKKAKVTLKKGKTFKIKAKVTKVKKSKKLMPKKHVATVRYLSTDKKIATVSSKGKIKAKGKGKCYVYAYAHNGVSKKITVKVK